MRPFFLRPFPFFQVLSEEAWPSFTPHPWPVASFRKGGLLVGRGYLLDNFPLNQRTFSQVPFGYQGGNVSPP